MENIGLEQAELGVEVIFFISYIHDLLPELLRDELNLISFWLELDLLAVFTQIHCAHA